MTLRLTSHDVGVGWSEVLTCCLVTIGLAVVVFVGKIVFFMMIRMNNEQKRTNLNQCAVELA